MRNKGITVMLPFTRLLALLAKSAFSILLITIFFTISTKVASAATFYVRPSVTDAGCTYGSCNGTSYANAWEGFTGGDGTPINWTTIDADNSNTTLFICGTHAQTFTPSQVGEVAAPIKIYSCETQYSASNDDPGVIDVAGAASNAIYMWNAPYANYLEFKGLRLANSTSDLMAAFNSSGLKIEEMTLDDAGGVGLLLHTITNLVISNITINSPASNGLSTVIGTGAVVNGVTVNDATVTSSQGAISFNQTQGVFTNLTADGTLGGYGILYSGGNNASLTATLGLSGTQSSKDIRAINGNLGGIYFISVHQNANIVLQNFESSYNQSTTGKAVYFTTADGITVRNGWVHHGVEGVYFGTGSDNNLVQNVISEYNTIDQLKSSFDSQGNIFENCIARYGGDSWVAAWQTATGRTAYGNDGIGVAFHVSAGSTTPNQIRYSLIYGNEGPGVEMANDTVSYVTNNLISQNGYSPGSLDLKGGIIIQSTGMASSRIQNNILYDNSPAEIYFSTPSPASTYMALLNAFDYNQYYHPDDSDQFYVDVTNDSSANPGYMTWAQYSAAIAALGTPQEVNSQYGDPLFTNLGTSDFTLQTTSPAIDQGTAISGLTTDYLGNIFYGAVDIGAYEFQPPFTMGTDELDIDGDVRVYTDGTFRNTQTPAGTTADLSVTPVGGFGAGDYSEWMDVAISAWNTSGTYKKTWTEESASIGSASTSHTVGDLRANQKYLVKVNNVLGANVTSADCSGNYCTSNSSGEIAFTYTGGYSTVTFDVEEDSTAPATFNLISPSGYTKDNTKPTLSFRKSSDANSVTSYSVSLDSGKNKSYSTSGIPASGNGSASYIWKDDTDVKIEFLNENDSDTTNDEIRVYFKGLNSNELTEGKHTWTATAYDQASNSTSQSADFYLDRTSPSISEFAIANVSTITPGVTYNISITNRMPSFSGLATDPYQGSSVTNSNGTKDTFDKVASGPEKLTLTIKKLKAGQSSTSKDAEYTDHFSKEYEVSDIQDVANDKKSGRFYITTPYPLVDGYYKVLLTLKDGAGNTYDDPAFYIALNNKGSSLITSPVETFQDLVTGKLDTTITKQETTPLETEKIEKNKKELEEQGYTVNVKVTDDQNKPVEGAKVTIHSKVQETTSDENGIATFNNVEPGDHRILIAYDGFEGEQNVTLTGDVKEFSFDITVRQQNPLLTPQVIAIVSALLVIVVILVILLLRSRSKRA